MWIDVTNHNRLDDPEHGDVLAHMVDASAEMAAPRSAARARAPAPGAGRRPPRRGPTVRRRRVDGPRERAAPRARSAPPGSTASSPCSAPPTGCGSSAPSAPSSTDGLPSRSSCPSATTVSCRVTLRPFLDSGAIACVDDVTEAAELRRELELRATFDALTACFSRSAILGALEHVATDGPGTGVVFVDLDRFKPVNDGSATPPATSCSSRSATGSARPCATSTSSVGSAATSSSSSVPASPTRSPSTPSPSGSPRCWPARWR